MNKVAVIGHFGGGKEFCDGQTVKTKNVTELLEKQSQIVVTRVDTYFSKANKIKLLLDTLRCLGTCNYIFLMVSVNGMRVYLPLLYYLNKITKRHIYHYVIGSELLDMVARNSKLVKYLNALDANWFEYESGTQYLKEKGVTNVSTLPNFKLISPIAEARTYAPDNGVYRFCTFSRVMKEKGITDAILAVGKAKNEHNKNAFLDIYGPVDPSYVEEFNHLLQLHSDCVAYKGVADSTQSVELLKNYFALLFPTFWPGEGFPGTLIDAFASGIPVVASDWNANKELIKNMEQGILYPSDKFQTLEEAVIWTLDHPEKMIQMRKTSRQYFDNYTSEAVWNVILAEMQKSGFTNAAAK